ncbi:MAG: 4Fe-4S dicluster domain-containing protein [Proteobacteria bacterium]|nr:4Fe-4S dicluster domain-containing protein [Pseudomonadota bacterium]
MNYTLTENCVLCGTCWEVCPSDSIVEHDWYYKIDESCMDCGMCMKVCPNAAIRKIRSAATDENSTAEQS